MFPARAGQSVSCVLGQGTGARAYATTWSQSLHANWAFIPARALHPIHGGKG